MYHYMTLSDETEVVHSHLKSESDVKTVLINFERPKQDGFDSARISLPSYQWVIRDGFTDEEIKNFENYSAKHAHNFFYYAEGRDELCTYLF